MLATRLKMQPSLKVLVKPKLHERWLLVTLRAPHAEIDRHLPQGWSVSWLKRIRSISAPSGVDDLTVSSSIDRRAAWAARTMLFGSGPGW